MIFVFGSNLAGRHGKGTALHAVKEKGAIYGKGVGRMGNSYAIPTMNSKMQILPLDKITLFINAFIQYAKNNKDLVFEVNRIGCDLAGYKDKDIAPLFKYAPCNCVLPKGWRNSDSHNFTY